MPIRKTINRISSIIGNAQFVALKRIEAEKKQRIFNEGKATDGSQIGKYRSDSYRKKRVNAGRQVGYKDLQYEGDLKRSMQVIKDGKRTVLGFTTNKQRIIAASQERQTGKTIFKTSKREKELAFKTIVAEIRRNVR